MTDKEKIAYAINALKNLRSCFADGSKLATLADESIFMLETDKFEQTTDKQKTFDGPYWSDRYEDMFLTIDDYLMRYEDNEDEPESELFEMDPVHVHLDIEDIIERESERVYDECEFDDTDNAVRDNLKSVGFFELIEQVNKRLQKHHVCYVSTSRSVKIDEYHKDNNL